MVETKIIVYGGLNPITFNIRPESKPLFKDEENKELFSNSKTSSKFLKEIVSKVFESISNAETKHHLKKGWTEKAFDKSSSLYAIIANATGKLEDEVQKTIKKYAKDHPEKILNMAREISEKTGITLDQIARDDFLHLMGCKAPSKHITKGIISHLTREEIMMKHEHIANCVLVELAAELFKINIVMRDFMILYDYGFMQGGIATEQIRIEVKAAEDAKELQLVQGAIMISPGFLSLSKWKKAKLKFYHIQPQELT